MQQKKVLILDANALLHRAWHALPPMTTPSGKVINAAYGFTSVLIKVLGSERPDFFAVCWDTPEPTFRHEALETYKATREKQPDVFYEQIPDAQKIVEVLGGTNVELPGYEADDLIGTLARAFEKKGHAVLILTGDRDALQLVSDQVSVLTFKKGVSETVRYTPAFLLEQTGLSAEQIVDYKALRGDTSDNIPGVAGIGEKTATDLIQRFGSLEDVLTAAKDPASDLKSGVRSKLLAGSDIARDTLPLVRIVTDAPIRFSEKNFIRRRVQEKEVLEVFEQFGFKSLVQRLFGSGSDSKPKQVLKSGRPSFLQETIEKPDQLDAFLRSGKDGIYLLLVSSAQGSLFDTGSDTSLYVGNGKSYAVLSGTMLEDPAFHLVCASMFADASIFKIGHGLKQLSHWLDERQFALKGISFDTELASYLLSAGERGHDLVTLSAAYLKRVLSADDPVLLFESLCLLHPVLQKALEEKMLTGVFTRIEMPLLPVLARMETDGIQIDPAHFLNLSKELAKEKSRLEQEMHQMAGESFNPLSPKQLTHILFEVLDISPRGIKRGKTGLSTAASELDKLRGSHPIIELIEQYREISKLLSTYAEAIPRLADKKHRVHTTFNQAVTATGRLSSSDPNLQNIPIRTELGREVRRGFVAPKGFLLLACDYSQIELRIAAALSKDAVMLDAFEHHRDIHTETAARIWDLDSKKITKDQRRVAKAINFGLIFGQGPQGLARTADISVDEAREFIDRYFDAFSGMREWMDYSKALAYKQGFVETLFGRRRPLKDIKSPLPQLRAQAERMAINMPVQGTEADLIKLAMIEVDRRLPTISKRSRLLLQVHDELVFEVPVGEVDTVTKAVSDIMVHIEDIGCPIVVDSKVGNNWGEMETL